MEKKSKAPEILRGFTFAKALFLKVVVICPNVSARASVPENFNKLYTLKKLVVYILQFNNCVLKTGEFSWVFKTDKDVL